MATKDTMTTGTFTFSGTAYYLTNMSYNEAYGTVDVTDTGTTGDGKEYLGGRAERTFSVDIWFDVSGSDLAMNTASDITMSFEGKTYVGSGSLYTKNIVGGIDEAIKATYTGQFNGAVTVTAD